MKNRPWIFLAVLCFTAFPVGTLGATPASLPMGNSLLDIIVRSNCSITISLQNTNLTGGYNTCGMSVDGISFNSYGDFQSYVASKASRLFGFLCNNATCARLKVNMTYTGMDSHGALTTCVGLSIDSNLDPNVGVTARSIIASLPTQPVVVPLSGVTSASIQQGTGSFSSMQLAGGNGIVFTDPTASSGGRVRVIVTFTDGNTVTYTQGGNPILEPTFSMSWVPALTPPPTYPYYYYDPYYYDDYYYDYFDYYYDKYYEAWNNWYNTYYGYYWQWGCVPTFGSYNIFVSGSLGADTVVEGTADFVTWSDIGGMSWNSPSSSTIIPISTTNQPMQFFRVKSY